MPISSALFSPINIPACRDGTLIIPPWPSICYCNATFSLNYLSHFVFRAERQHVRDTAADKNENNRNTLRTDFEGETRYVYVFGFIHRKRNESVWQACDVRSFGGKY